MAQDQNDFAVWLLYVRNGTANFEKSTRDDLEVPQELCATGSLVTEIFGDITPQERCGQIIISPKNSHCLIFNEEVLNQLPGTETIYYSADKVLTDNPLEVDRFPQKFIHSLTPSGIPPHNIKLKSGAIIINHVIKEHFIENGLCNKTRLEIVAMVQYCITATLRAPLVV